MAQRDNLPLQPTPLIGREQEIAGIGDRLGEPHVRLLTLTGPAGVGKTRLAIAAATRLTEEFEHGVCFVDLAPLTDPALVPSAIARALGVPETGGGALPEAVTAYLRDKQILLLLDNVEHLLPAAAAIGELLAACPRLRVLATSRSPLRIRWEHRFPVEPLPVSGSVDAAPTSLGAIASVTLFAERARAADPEFSVSENNAAAIAALCSRLDGLPLAIELAAARVPQWSPDRMLAQLDRGLGVLDAGLRDLPQRQRSLGAAIGWSYALLTPDQQAVFRRLGVFAGGCTLPAVAATAAASGDVVVEALDTLVDARLLRRETDAASDGPGRYRMLETIRQFAREHLEATDETKAAQRAHAAYLQSLAEQAEPHLKSGGREPWLAWLDAELDNIRASLTWCLTDAASLETGLRLAAVLEWYWHFRNHWREGWDWLERLLTHSGVISISVRAKALYVSGRLAVFLNDFRGARSRLDDALVMARELGDPALVASALVYRSRLLAREGAYDEARVDALESENLFLGMSDRWGAALAAYYVAETFFRQEDDEQATSHAARSSAAFRDLGDDWGTVLPFGVLYAAAIRRSDFAAARAIAKEGLARSRRTGERYSMAGALLQLAGAYQMMGNIAAAEEHYGEAMAISNEIGELPNVILARVGLGSLAHAKGDRTPAMEQLSEALSLAARPPAVAICLATIAGFLADQGSMEQAARLAGAAERFAGVAGLMPLPVPRLTYHRIVAAMQEAAVRDPAVAAALEEGRTLPVDIPVEALLALVPTAAGPAEQHVGGGTAGLSPRGARYCTCLRRARQTGRSPMRSS